MQTIKKRIYATTGLLLLVLGFTIFAHYYIRAKTREKVLSERILYLLNGLQSQSEEIAQVITAPAVQPNSTDPRSMMSVFNGQYAMLVGCINRDHFTALQTPALFQRDLAALNEAYNDFTALAAQAVNDTKTPYWKDLRFIGQVRSGETNLQKLLQSITLTFYAVDTLNEQRIQQMNRYIIFSLLAALLAVTLLLIIPAIRLHLQHYQRLQQMLKEVQQSEALVQVSERKYHYLFDCNPLPMWIYDPDTLRFLEVNQMAIQHYGYSYEEFTSMTICEIRPAHELPRLWKLMASCSNTYDEVMLRGTWEHIKKNGERIFVNIVSHNITYNNKTAVLILANDITQEKELQQQLIEEKLNRQRAIAKAALDVQEKERNEIGCELHDNVNQILTAAKLYVGYMMEDQSTEHLSTTKELIGMAVEEIRRISKVFAPPCLQNTGFIFSIEGLLQHIAITTNIRPVLDCETFDEHLVDDSLKLTIYRILQEQTTNIVKYAEATHVRIALSHAYHTISVKITDDGKGFDMNQPFKGTGLLNMMNRVDIYQGKMTLCSAPGKGCVLQVEFPLPQAAVRSA